MNELLEEASNLRHDNHMKALDMINAHMEFLIAVGLTNEFSNFLEARNSAQE